MWEKHKTQIIIAIVIIVTILVIYFYGKRQGKKYIPREVELPPDLQGPNVPDNWNPGPYTDAIRDDVYGYFNTHSATPYNDLLTLSNSQFVAVYNDWNRRYFKEHNETFPQAIKKEGTVWNYSWVTAAAAVLKRAEKLGLE